MSQAQTAAGFEHQVRCIAHALHPSRDYTISRVCPDGVKTQHHCLHGRAAHLVDGGAARIDRDAGADGRLARRRLAQSCRQHTAHDGLVYLYRIDVRSFHCGLDGNGAQLRGRHGLTGLPVIHPGGYAPCRQQQSVHSYTNSCVFSAPLYVIPAQAGISWTKGHPPGLRHAGTGSGDRVSHWIPGQARYDERECSSFLLPQE